MLFFSDYLSQNKVRDDTLLDTDAKDYHLHAWLTRFKDNIKECRALYPACYDSLSTGFKIWWNQFLKKSWTVLNKSKMISEVDDIARYIYNSLIKYTVLQSKYNPILPTLSAYPYDRRHSGVSICAYLVIEKAKKPVIFSNLFLQANDYLQSKDLRENVYDIQSEIQKALKTSRLSKGAKLLISRGLQSFHAEYYWFTVRLQELVILIENNKNMFPDFSEKADEFLLLNLIKLPRLEFVMTTSPCKDCQDFLFKELRLTLNALNVKLPIIIFANSPYNTAEVNESPIAIVKNDGTYYVTGLMSKLPYYVKNQLRFINQSVVCKLFSEEQKTFFELDSVVNEFMPSIIVAPQVVKKHFFFSMMELFFEDGTVNWNTNRWTTWFFQRFGARYLQLPADYLTQDSPKSLDDEFQMLVEAYGSLNTPQPEVNEAFKKEIERILQEPIGRGDHFFSDMAENLISMPSDITDDVIDTYMIKKLEYLEWAKGFRELNTDEVAQYECMSENIMKATENEKKEIAEYKKKIERDKEIALKAQVKLWSDLEVSTPLILSRASSSNSRNQNSLISTERKHAFSGIETDDLRAIQNNHHYNILQSFLSSLEASLHLARTKALERREKKPELLEQLKTVVKILFSPEYRMKVSYHFSFKDNVLERFKKDKYLKPLEKHLVIFEKLDILSESEFKELLLSISNENLTNQDKRNFMSFYNKKKAIAENLKRTPRPVVGQQLLTWMRDINDEMRWQEWIKKYKEKHPDAEENGYGPGALVLSSNFSG